MQTSKEFSDNLSQQIVNISKAAAFDVVSKQVGELQEENKNLKGRIIYLENLISEYTGKMLDSLNGKYDDIPAEVFQSPGTK